MNKNILLLEKDKKLKAFWIDVLQDEGFNVIDSSKEKDYLNMKDYIQDFIFLGTGLDADNIKNMLEEMRQKNPQLMVVSPANPAELINELDAIKERGLSYKEHPIQVDQVKAAIRDALRLQELKGKYNFNNLIGKSQQIKNVFNKMTQVINSHTTTVLVTGDTGTGKEEVAKAIHYNSSRAEKPFMAVSCTAVPETLMESELFGHEQGAFTDAKSMKKGLLELADKGTVFLDEIGDMKMGLQSKLLRFLEEKKVRRIGGTKDIKVDIRVIAATNKDLPKMVKEGAFREDLFYRLKVFPINIPPLRERREDIVLLAQYFIKIFGSELRKDIKGLTFSATEKINSFQWPGNVRELKNVIERAVILCNGNYIGPNELVLEDAAEEDNIEKDLSLTENEKRLIKKALKSVNGNQSKAAKMLGITRFALRNRMKKYGIC